MYRQVSEQEVALRHRQHLGLTTRTSEPSSVTSTSPPRTTLPRGRNTPSERRELSIAANRLFRRVSQSSQSWWMSRSFVSRRNRVPTTSVIIATMIGYQSP